jgi:hypothetical protein
VERLSCRRQNAEGVSHLVDTRLPPGTRFDSDDWFEVLRAVFDPLDAQAQVHPWGSTADEYRSMTRGQQAVFNLQWLRDYMQADTFLEYAHEPWLRPYATRLVDDALLVGALPFVETIRKIAPLVTGEYEPPYPDGFIHQVSRLEHEIFALEEQHAPSWNYLADYVRRRPHEFVRPH